MLYIETTFWTEEKFTFDKLCLISINRKTDKKKVIDYGDCNKPSDLSAFFKRVSRFKLSDEERTLSRQGYDRLRTNQFGVIRDGQIVPVIWFDIVCDEIRYKHNRCFDVTLITKNNIKLPFGRIFPKGNLKTKYRELKVASSAYKYLSNQLKNK